MVNIDERVEKARSYFKEGYNCCQAVVLAYSDIADSDQTLLATISASFGGGMGRLREVCGAVSGMSILASFISPSPTARDSVAKAANYALVQGFAESFRQQNRSIVCRELLGLNVTKEDPRPSERTAEYYKKRPCADLVGDAARIVGEYLNARDGLDEKCSFKLQ